MEFVTIEFVEKFLNPNHLITFSVIWFFVKKQTAAHFKSIEGSLEKIGSNILDLKESIMDLERTQTKKINDLGERVTRLETTNK
jgi:hypothetical protein